MPRVGLGRAKPLRKPHQHHSDPAGSERADIAPMDLRDPERRQAALDRSDDLDPVVFEAEHLHQDDPEQHGDQRPRNGGRKPAQTDDHPQRHHTDEQRQAVRLAEVGDDVPQLLEEVATAC